MPTPSIYGQTPLILPSCSTKLGERSSPLCSLCVSLVLIRSIQCSPVRIKIRHGELSKLEQKTTWIDIPSELLLLQLLHHMQSRADSSAFLSRPEQILPFIDYALQARPSENRHDLELIGEGPESTLRVVREEDSEDENDTRGDMMRTAVNLLLSLFEGEERSSG